MTTMRSERLGALARGVLAGDALSWPNAGYRIRLVTPKRLARMEVLAAFAREHGTTTPPVPYSHSSPVEVLQPGPGEPTEWFAFAAETFVECADAGALDPLAARWRRLAETDGTAVRIGTRIALGNIRRGLTSPQSGNDNPHYFDDMPMVRAVASAAVFGEERASLAATTADAGFTGARDGLWCAEATAVLFSALLAGATAQDAITASLTRIPDETWSRRLAVSALGIAGDSGSPVERAHRLSVEAGDWVYSYSTVAPETFAFLIAHLSAAPTADDLLLGVLAQPRNAPSLPALAGAAAAILFGEAWMPRGLGLDTPLGGVSVPELAGRTLRACLQETGPERAEAR